MAEPLCPMSQVDDASGKKKVPGDSDKLWLVVRSLKNAEGKIVRSYILFNVLVGL